jgi:hypothetical protein
MASSDGNLTPLTPEEVRRAADEGLSCLGIPQKARTHL